MLVDKIVDLRLPILRWYRRHRRDLPWRGEASPYRVWVSEVMLQQTQVATATPYYHRFIARFPDIQSLASAPLDEVLKLWEGLGYYARARHLHRAAQEIVEKHRGRLPDNYAALRRLPGFGDYTAAAVASIAFGEPVPAVDGNARRVLARLFAVTGIVTRNPAARRIRELAQELVDPHAPGDWNQALIELGALVCLPKQPHCTDCPVQTACLAHRQGLEQTIPAFPARKKLPHFDVTAAVIHRNGKVLIAQRPADGMLGGLWEFPGGKKQPGESLPDCLKREIREELAVEIEVGEPVVSVQHSYTHFKITLHAFHCRLVAGQPQAVQVADWRWVTLEELDRYAFPTTDRQIIAALRKAEGRVR